MEQGSLNSLFLATKLNIAITATAIPATNLTGRRSFVIKNESTSIIYLGGSTVTVAQGYKLPAGDEKSFDVGDDIILYGIVSAGTAELRVLEGA